MYQVACTKQSGLLCYWWDSQLTLFFFTNYQPLLKISQMLLWRNSLSEDTIFKFRDKVWSLCEHCPVCQVCHVCLFYQCSLLLTSSRWNISQSWGELVNLGSSQLKSIFFSSQMETIVLRMCATFNCDEEMPLNRYSYTIRNKLVCSSIFH